MSQEIIERPLNVAVLTVSDTRTMETDKGGNKDSRITRSCKS